MFKKLAGLFLAATLSLTAFADAPIIWKNSNFAEFLTAQGWQFKNNGKKYIDLSADPSAGAGLTAPIGSVGVRNNGGVTGEMWLKTGAADTAWSNVLNSSIGWTVTGNSSLNAATNFLGTTDAVDLVFRTDNTERFKITSTGVYDTTLGAGIVQSNGLGHLSSGLAPATSLSYTPVAANWLVDPATVQEALDNLSGAKIENLWYVSRTAGVDSAACGMALNPCLTISQALTNMGDSASADDVKNSQTVLIEGGSYDEALTIPDGRIVNLIGLGTVILGDAAGANLSSTTPRSIAFNPTNASVFGTGLKPSLNIGTVNPSEATSTFVAEANGFYVSGDIAIGGDGISHNVNLHGVKLFGNMTKTSLGLTNLTITNSYIVGALNLSSGQTILERTFNSEFDGLITVTEFNHMQNCEVDGGMTVTGVGNFMPPSGMFHVDFAGTFTGVANSARFDLATDYFFRTNGASLAGGATKVILSPYASATVDGILSSTDWNTFNNKLSSSLTDTYIFVGNGSNVATGVPMSGDATLANTGALTIANNAVTDAKLRDSAALSVIGRSVNSSGDPADITAGADGNILRRSGTTLGFGSIDLSQSGAVGASVLPIANGGTNLSSVGSANQLFGTNATGDAFEHKAVTASAVGALTAPYEIKTQQRFVAEDPGAGSNTVTIQAPTLTGSYTLTLPIHAGANGQILSSDGSGSLSWVDDQGGGAGGAIGSTNTYTFSIFGEASNPVKGTTSRDTGYYFCNGSNILRLVYDYRQTAGGGDSGSGEYSFSLPAGYTVNTGMAPQVTSSDTPMGTVGEFWLNANNSYFNGHCYSHTTSNARVRCLIYPNSGTDTQQTVSSTNTPLNVANWILHLDLWVPVNECD